MPLKRIHWFLLLLLEAGACALVYGLLPLVLPLLPEGFQAPLYAGLTWVFPPVMGALLPFPASRRGLAAFVACLLPPAAYLSFLRFAEISPGVLIVSFVISVVSAVAGQELYQRARSVGKRRP